MVAADAALCNFNDGKVRCRGARELCGEAQKTTRCVRELAEAYHLLSGRSAVPFCSGVWSTLNRQYIVAGNIMQEVAGWRGEPIHASFG